MDETKQRKLLLYACILWKYNISQVEQIHFRAAAKLTTAWLYLSLVRTSGALINDIEFESCSGANRLCSRAVLRRARERSLRIDNLRGLDVPKTKIAEQHDTSGTPPLELRRTNPKYIPFGVYEEGQLWRRARRKKSVYVSIYNLQVSECGGNGPPECCWLTAEQS
ncbi:hypothetical protein EVAR_16057_1 [Eumeta japonica]|uniref:Uncharacterized protein n=1 Tax=Eumeta variegata TaxID=151549 RepID=A0A4C1VYT6_EUMVA|nr:hypothetical protein EVAR_16057_1 [Eumeta japonica]